MTLPFVCHCHIPKTGGSALNRRLLFPRFGEEGVAQFYRYVFECANRVPRRHTSPLMRRDAAAGHVGIGYVERPYPNALYIAVMREPVERMLSFLSFVLNTPGHKVHQRLPDTLRGRAQEDPEAFVAAVLDDPWLAVVQSNVQTRLIAGCARLGDRPMDHEDLTRAMDHATRPDVAIGDQNTLDAFISDLEDWLPAPRADARPVPLGAVQEKRLPRRLTSDMLSARVLTRLTQANALDLRLYETVAGRRPVGWAAAA